MISLVTISPNFFLRVPDRKPRTLWSCQPVPAASSFTVAPELRLKSFKIKDDFVLARVILFELRDAAIDSTIFFVLRIVVFFDGFGMVITIC